MDKRVKSDDVYEMLNSIGGCGAERGSFADGWDSAIDAAIKSLATIPAADMPSGKIELRPCPFCGNSEIDSGVQIVSRGRFSTYISCGNCSCVVRSEFKTDGFDDKAMSLEELSELLNNAVATWNKRTEDKTYD